MVIQGYEEIDHTADLALRVWGEDLFGVFRQSAQGMFMLMNITINPSSPIEGTFSIEEGTPETMLVDFLNEVLYFCGDKKRAYETFSFSKQDEHLIVSAGGYKISFIERNIKAVTFHDLNIKSTEFGMETTLTFDV